MAETVHGMLMAGRVLCDPLVAGAIPQHAARMILQMFPLRICSRLDKSGG
jgi:hypothetical protein